MNSAFPDINVWLALTCEAHEHHGKAMEWLRATAVDSICFCRITQMGLLRLLSTQIVMQEEVMSQARAWAVYDAWYKKDDRIRLEEEPSLVEAVFRGLTRSAGRVAPGYWADAYITAFAQLIGATVVTFDHRLALRAQPNSLLLE